MAIQQKCSIVYYYIIKKEYYINSNGCCSTENKPNQYEKNISSSPSVQNMF